MTMDESEESTIIEEGLAKVKFRKGEVFYNPVQVVNRDLSVLMLRDFVQVRRRERENARAERMGRAEQGTVFDISRGRVKSRGI